MGERTSYAPGTFSWSELITSDADGAKAFYTKLFGWTYDDRPAGEGQVYSMALRDGKLVGALAAGDDAAALELLRVGRERRPLGGAGRRAGRDDPGRAVRRHGRRPDGRDRRPERQRAAPLAGRADDRRGARQRGRRADVERPDHARRREVDRVLRPAVRLDVPRDPGVRRLPGDQERRALQRRHDAARRRPAGLDAVLRPRGRRARDRSDPRLRRHRVRRADAPAERHDRRRRRPAGRGVRRLHRLSTTRTP